MAQTMTIAWTLPTKRSDGTALAAGEIASTEVALSSDGGLGYTVIGNVAPNATQQFARPDLVDGAYKVRLTVVDSAGRRGVPATGDAVVKTIAPPAAPVIASIVIA